MGWKRRSLTFATKVERKVEGTTRGRSSIETCRNILYPGTAQFVFCIRCEAEYEESEPIEEERRGEHPLGLQFSEDYPPEHGERKIHGGHNVQLLG